MNTEFYKQILLKIYWVILKTSHNKRTNTPCTLNNITNDKPFDPTTYKSVSLIYLAKCTRPDISFIVHHDARQCENPIYDDHSADDDLFDLGLGCQLDYYWVVRWNRTSILLTPRVYAFTIDAVSRSSVHYLGY